jgi:nicotianamine synthase-like protein
MFQTFGLEDIKKKLLNIANIDLTIPEEVRHSGLMLENLLLNKKFTFSEEDELLDYLSKKGSLRKIQLLYEKFETGLEVSFAREIVREHLSAYQPYLMYERFMDLIKNEIKLAYIERRENVLFLGSGPFPITAILLNKLAGCNVDCYEKDKKYVELSKKVISQLGLAGKIRIKNIKGECFSNNNYSTIIVALLAKPKGKILQMLKESISIDTKIICRTSDKVRQVFYEATNENHLSGYKMVKKNYAKGNQTISSVLLKKVNS